MHYFKKCNEKDRSPYPRKSCGPLKLPHKYLQLNMYSLSNMSLFDQFLKCLMETGITQIKQSVKNSVAYIECMKHKQQLKINFLAGKQKMKLRVLSITISVPRVGWQARFSF